MLSQNRKSLTHAIEKIHTLDLRPVISRLVKTDNWTLDEALFGSKQYRNFLILKLKYGQLYSLLPSRDIDDFWYAHILQTESYVDFCQDVYGQYIHHSYQVNSHEQLIDKFENETQELYFEEFGEYIVDIRTLPENIDWLCV